MREDEITDGENLGKGEGVASNNKETRKPEFGVVWPYKANEYE